MKTDEKCEGEPRFVLPSLEPEKWEKLTGLKITEEFKKMQGKRFDPENVKFALPVIIDRSE